MKNVHCNFFLWLPSRGAHTHLEASTLHGPFFLPEAAVGTAGGQLVKGVGLLSWSDLLQLFNFKETAFLSVKS